MCDKVIRMGSIAVALILAIAAVLPLKNAIDVMIVMRFFQAMMPVLAVGALLKYLMS